MWFQLTCTLSLLINFYQSLTRLFSRPNLNTLQNSLLFILVLSLYSARFMEHNQEEDDFYYAHAKAAGSVLKYTFPLVFFPMLRVLNELFHEWPHTQNMAREIDRHKIHQILGISITAFASVHGIAHILNKGGLRLNEQEWLTGFAMLSLILGPITGMYLWRFKLHTRFSYYYQFLLPHQIGWWGMLLGFAFHTKDLRLLPLSLFILSAFSLDRCAEWFFSKTTPVNSVRFIHDSMMEVLLEKPSHYPKHKPGDYILLSAPWPSFLLNGGHPFSLACCAEEDKIRLIISTNGKWSKRLRETLVSGYRVQLTAPFPSRLSLLGQPPADMTVVTTGSGLAIALAYLNSFSNNGGPESLHFYHSSRHQEEIELLSLFIQQSAIRPKKVQFNLTGPFSKTPALEKEMTIKNDRLNPKAFENYKGVLFYCGNRALGKQLKQSHPAHQLRIENF